MVFEGNFRRLPRRWLGFFCFLVRRFNEVGVTGVSASLTFATLLALVPVLTMVLVVMSAFPIFGRLSSDVFAFIDGYLLPQGADALRNYLDTFQSNAGNLTAMGVLFLLLSAIMLIRTIDQTFNRIWRVENRRPLWTQFLVYWALLTFAPLALAASLSLWGGLVRWGGLDGDSDMAGVFRLFGSVLMNCVILWLLYRVVPNRYVPSSHALAGAALTAVLLESARRGFAWYMGTFNSYTLIYGAFAAVPVFLIWLNILWMLLLSGALLTASLSYLRDDAFLRPSGGRSRFDDVLKILLLLSRAQNECPARAMRVQELRHEISMGYDELGDLLEKLAEYGYVYNGEQGWVLKTNAEHIGLDGLFRLFAYCPETCAGDAAGHAVADILAPCMRALDMSLAQFERGMCGKRPPEI
ncbi:MAG: YihY family inner membrane protein [Neisseria sp.]|nr:YihY family inner membrane protein [Neisseria sp.]